MMIARAKCAAVCGTTDRMLSPSRTCKCQSSGVVIVMDVCAAAAAATVEAAGAAAIAAAADHGCLLLLVLVMHLPVGAVSHPDDADARLPAERWTHTAIEAGSSGCATCFGSVCAHKMRAVCALTAEPAGSSCSCCGGWQSLPQHADEHVQLR